MDLFYNHQDSDYVALFSALPHSNMRYNMS